MSEEPVTIPGEAAERWHMPDLNVAPPSAGKLDELAESAYEEGFQRGREEGLAAGQAEIRARIERLETLLGRFAKPLAEVDAEVEQALVMLASEVAGALLCRELRTDPDALLPMVREALATLGDAEREVALHLHPDDVDRVREEFDANGSPAACRLVADAGLAAGECRLETDAAVIDGRFEARLARVREQLLGAS